VQITDWAIILPTVLGTSGLAGLIFQRKKTKAEAEGGVVNSAEGVLRMYETLVGRMQVENVELRTREAILHDRIAKLEAIIVTLRDEAKKQ